MSVETYENDNELYEADVSHEIWGSDETFGDERDALGYYLQTIGKIALLNAEQEVELAKKIEAGLFAQRLLEGAEYSDGDLRLVADQGQAARDQMISANLRLVVSTAKRYSGKGVPLIDMIQDGNMGLMHAVEMFDYKKGFKFSTYATWWIRQAVMRRSWEQSRMIRLPGYVTEKIMTITAIGKEITDATGRPATDHEIAERMNISVAELQKINSYGRDMMSLDAVLTDESDGDTFGDILVDEHTSEVDEVLAYKHRRQMLNNAFDQIDPREARILRLRLGWDDGVQRTLNEIAQS